METFTLDIRVGRFKGSDTGEMIEVSVIVSSGPYHPPGYAMLPESLLTALGISPVGKQPIEFADGRIEMCDVGAAWIAYNEEQTVCPDIFGPEGEYLLGFLTPGFLSLKVDPVGKKLVPDGLIIYSVN